MNTKSTRMKMKMGGLMCQSQAAAAVCVPADPRSVIAPQRPKAEHAKLINSSVVGYARLVDHRRLHHHHHHHSRRFSSADHDKFRSSTPARSDVKAIQKPPPPMAFSKSTVQVFQAYIDSSGIIGQAGDFQYETGKYTNIEYMKCMGLRIISFLICQILQGQTSSSSALQIIQLAKQHPGSN